MRKFIDIWTRICRKWMKIRLQPIRVFCFHHVCERFDAESMNQGDWMQIDEFKSRAQAMQHDGVEFISLTDAYSHICNDWFRHKRYAVLTFDDGYASLKEILPWLEERQIPVTLFINGKYLDGESYRINPNEKYLNKEELFSMTSPLIEIGSHGWEHTDASKMSTGEFLDSIGQNAKLLLTHPRYVPFHAYTWGKYTKGNHRILSEMNITSVMMDGKVNYNEEVIHRESLK